MPITTLDTAGNIVNRAAAECGIQPVQNPYASTDPAFIQMRYLLNTCGEELARTYPWELLVKAHQITTSNLDTGNYPLPDDYLYMIDQTGWERRENVPLYGPLSPQEWTYLLGRDLVTSTIYASFRLKEGQFSVFPQPPPDNLDINFEYISKNWVQNGEDANEYYSEIQKNSDIPQYDKTLISRYLKVKYLEAKGFDTTKAQDDFNQIFTFMTGRDKGGKVLNAGGRQYGVPLLNGWRNLPDTGYGM